MLCYNRRIPIPELEARIEVRRVFFKVISVKNSTCIFKKNPKFLALILESLLTMPAEISGTRQSYRNRVCVLYSSVILPMTGIICRIKEYIQVAEFEFL